MCCANWSADVLFASPWEFPAAERGYVFVRKKTVKGHDYYAVIQGFRDPDGRVRHHVVVSLKRHPSVAAALRSCKAKLSAARRQHEKLESGFPTSSPRAAWVLREIESAAAQVRMMEAWLSRLEAAAVGLAQQRKTT